MNPPSRRRFLAGAAASLAAVAGAYPAQSAQAEQTPTAPATAPTSQPAEPSFRYCLNTATIMGQNLGIVKQLEIAAETGYSAVEPWLRDLDAYTKAGNSLDDLRKRISDLGISIESAIGFATWIASDESARKTGLEQMKRDMETIAKIGGKRIAAPPAGAKEAIPLPDAAERYRAVCELGEQIGVVPEVEFWGPSKSLHRLCEAAYVAMESGHPSACVLPDVYHLYKGGSDPAGLRLFSGSAIHVIHMNDYPADPPREKIADAQRVFPGEGIAPLTTILRNLRDSGFHGFLSLELFNKDYWKQSPVKVARSGLEKMREAVEKAVG